MNRSDELENRSIYIIREAYSHFEEIAAQFLHEKPVKFRKNHSEGRVY
jgi:hypothetical protein